jgi:hypothetical protein
MEGVSMIHVSVFALFLYGISLLVNVCIEWAIHAPTKPPTSAPC